MKKSFFHNRFYLFILWLMRIMGGLLTIFFAFILQKIVDIAVSMDFEKLSNISIFSIIFCVILTVLYFLILYLGNRYINKATLILRNSYLDNLIQRNLYCWGTVDSSKYLSALTNDMQNISQNYYQNLLSLPDDIICIIGSFVAVMFYNYIIGLTMLGLTVFMAVIPALLKNKLEKGNFLLSTRNKNYVEKIKEVINGINEIKSYQAEDVYMNKAHNAAEDVCDVQNSIAKLIALISQSSTFVSNILQLGIMCLTAYFVIIKQLSVGAIIAIFALLSKFYYPIQSLADKIVGITSMRSVSKELDNVLQADPSYESECINEIEYIEFSHVNFSYTGAEPYSVKDFSATFEKNCKYLILGESGSGKSTILKLIHKELIPYEGSIKINGIELSSIKDNQIFARSANVKQENFIFNADIYANIDLQERMPHEKIEQILKIAQLQTFVSSLSSRNYIIDEEVSKVSGGEKARINLARAIAKKSELLLFDEITAAMDKDLATYIEKLILSQDATVINVSHRFDFSNLEMYDRIIIMENGKIIANDSVSEIKKTGLLTKYQNIEDNA